MGATEYFTAANDSILVIVQIETPEGVQNVESIAAVDGIGAWFSPRGFWPTTENISIRCPVYWAL